MIQMLFLSFLVSNEVLAQSKKGVIQRFDGSDMPVIRTKIRFTTVVVLPEGEEYQDVICGDKDFWVIEGRYGSVYIKPTREGLMTNINIISKSKIVYSFLVKEISKPGMSREMPELKVVLDGDETAKLRKEKENVEELLLRSERSLKELTEKLTEEIRKREQSAAPKVETPKTQLREWEVRPAPKQELKKRSPESVPRTRGMDLKPFVPIAHTVVSPGADFKVMTVERREGLLRKTSRFFGRLFQCVNDTLRIY